MEEDIRECGIEIGRVSVFRLNGRLKRALGQCKVIMNGYEISLNRCMLLSKVPEQEVKNTIAHELLHTCPECMNHGKKWKAAAAVLMSRKPCYTISRTVDVSRLNCDAIDLGYRCVE